MKQGIRCDSCPPDATCWVGSEAVNCSPTDTTSVGLHVSSYISSTHCLFKVCLSLAFINLASVIFLPWPLSPP